jgi:Tol biopolymer transport system component
MRRTVLLSLVAMLAAACASTTEPGAPGSGSPDEIVVGPPPIAQGRIAFESAEDGDWEIFTMSPNGSGRTQLTYNSTWDQNATWKGMSQLAFRSGRNGGFDVYRMEADGTQQVRISTSLASLLLTETEIAYSPNGARIAFQAGSEIYVMNANGTGIVNLTNHPAHDTDPTWSPDGASIAFWSTRSGNAQLHIIPAAGGAATQITFYESLGGTAIHPDWSPDGQWIAFLWTGSSDDGELYRVRPNGSELTRLTHTAAGESSPSWSPDSKRLAYARDGEIWVMKKDGTGQVNITGTGTMEAHPVWSR